jgi:hypothetical protein
LDVCLGTFALDFLFLLTGLVAYVSAAGVVADTVA